ncbi:hypothetical protein M2352_002659 [Azospirillum fermentarium]|uniref:NepR family anti-sigma factor n=1 Tax=Azospirillum fermentarium TaxID=1233114 RepID=UPI002227DA1A|nr:NepR family anti-sigma factor [Azospirillum fermentarium]MCW2247068.1 hypothetical protein [Azospirillum fermentarium]
MKDETVTRFRRETRTPLQTPTAQDAAPDAGPWDDGLPDLSRQHVAALHRMYDPILNEPIPDRMLTLLRRYTR